MTTNLEPPIPKMFRFRLLAILLLIAVVALWLTMWREDSSAATFVVACIPFGLLIYVAACVGARHGHPILVGTVTGVLFGILGTVAVYGILDGGPIVLDHFAHLTITGLVVGLACGFIAWLKKPPVESRR